MRNRTYGGVRGRKTKVGRKLLRFPPTRLYSLYNIYKTIPNARATAFFIKALMVMPAFWAAIAAPL